MAYESNIIPSQRILAEDMRFHLLPDFEADPHSWRVGFDLTKVRVLADDEDKKVRRLNVAYQGGMVTRAEVRRELGLPIDPDRDNVYLLPLNTTEVLPDGSMRQPGEPMATNGNGGGGP